MSKIKEAIKDIETIAPEYRTKKLIQAIIEEIDSRYDMTKESIGGTYEHGYNTAVARIVSLLKESIE